MGKRRFFVYAMMIVAFACAGLWADDLNPPLWRGQALTTMQSWEFGTNQNPSAPDIDNNPFGTASASVVYDSPFTPWLDNDCNHQGVWFVEDRIDLFVPNSSVPNPIKYMWLQLTFYSDSANDPQIFSIPGLSMVEKIQKIQLDDYYWHGTYRITIEPNPSEETLYIMPRDCTILIDEIVLDTLCIPEPAMAGLLGSSMCLLLCSRRHLR
ncbi:MAG: hypothetical protein ABIG61_05125 [Planctomycetota bacterium]